MSRNKSKRCGKVYYKNELEAKIGFMRTFMAKDDSTRTKSVKRYYRCPRCAGFHLTSKERNSRNKVLT